MKNINFGVNIFYDIKFIGNLFINLKFNLMIIKNNPKFILIYIFFVFIYFLIHHIFIYFYITKNKLKYLKNIN